MCTTILVFTQLVLLRPETNQFLKRYDVVRDSDVNLISNTHDPLKKLVISGLAVHVLLDVSKINQIGALVHPLVLFQAFSSLTSSFPSFASS